MLTEKIVYPKLDLIFQFYKYPGSDDWCTRFDGHIIKPYISYECVPNKAGEYKVTECVIVKENVQGISRFTQMIILYMERISE